MMLKLLMGNFTRSGGAAVSSCEFVPHEPGVVKVVFEDSTGNCLSK